MMMQCAVLTSDPLQTMHASSPAGGLDDAALLIDPRAAQALAAGLAPKPFVLLGPHTAGRQDAAGGENTVQRAGSNLGNGGWVQANAQGSHGQPFSLKLTLPPLATVALRHGG
jgi:hypothetical protein